MNDAWFKACTISDNRIIEQGHGKSVHNYANSKVFDQPAHFEV